MVALNTLVDTTLNLADLDGASRVRPFAGRTALDDATKNRVYGQRRRAVAGEVLSRRHDRSPSGIDRAMNEVRARRILGSKLEYMYSSVFDEPGADATILAPTPPAGTRQVAARAMAPAGLPSYLASLYDAPLLSREQESHLFRKMNYLKYRASKIRNSLDPVRAEAADLDEIERLEAEALDLKNQIIRANLRLVVSIAKKRLGGSTDFFELVSDGNMSLIGAVDKFDFSRGFKFSTYASWAVMKNFARAGADETSRRGRFVTGQEEALEHAADHRSAEHELESDYGRDRHAVYKLVGKLNQRERRILVGRYGIGGASELTLAQLGKELGISKERVRQLESRAHEKLRQFAGT
jgi:RNA polymerase primary sigma factor